VCQEPTGRIRPIKLPYLGVWEILATAGSVVHDGSGPGIQGPPMSAREAKRTKASHWPLFDPACRNAIQPPSL